MEGALRKAGLAAPPEAPPRPLVAAVSGGPDSLALLYALADLKEACRLALTVAHLDHALRPDSAADALFVARQAKTLGLPFRAERIDVAAYRRSRRLSLEQAAREVRYAFLARTAREVGAPAIALGHTADDQAETVLLHILRGSGLAGLRGMSLLSPYMAPDGSGVQLFRPLLETTRQETEAFCGARGLAPRRDESNRSLRFVRNRLRWEVFPLLYKVNPSVREALLRLARAAALDLEHLEAGVEEAWPLVAEETAGGLTLEKKAFASLHPALQRHLLRRAYAHLAGGTEGLLQAHVEAMASLLDGPAGRRMALPGGVYLEAGHRQALLWRGPSYPCPFPPLEGEHPLQVPGETSERGWRVQTELLSPPLNSLPHDPFQAVLDAEAMGGPMALRPRRPGERFHPLGMEGPKKLQDFFVDAHVPRPWRERVPLVVSPRGIVWVVGWRIAHWARVTQNTRRILRLRFFRLAGGPGVE